MRQVKRKRSLMDKLIGWLAVGLVLLATFTIVYLSISYDIDIWHECRQDHSWMYCQHVLSR
jgi:hypothetical protein